jgi:ABC-type glycerol-3-phosphate transport system substrate-binding protein
MERGVSDSPSGRGVRSSCSSGLPWPESSWSDTRRQFLLGLGATAACWAGCRPSPPPIARNEDDEPPAPLALSLLVIDDLPLAESIRRQWELRGEGELEVLTRETHELLEDPRGPVTDGVIFPSGMLGEMVQRNWLLPFPEDLLQDTNLAFRDVFDTLRLREATWSRTVYGIPLGSPVFLLWYRLDEWERRELAPPRTWADYMAAVTQLRESLGDDSPQKATAEPLAEGWGSQLLLARAAGYARSRSFLASWFDGVTMRPLVDGPPFVRALEEILQTAGGPAALELTPGGAWAQFMSGQALSAITWPTTAGWPRGGESAATPGAEGGAALPPRSIGVSELPGANDAYDRVRGTWSPRGADEGEGRVSLAGTAGRLAAVTRRTTNRRGTAALLGWLAGREWGEQVVSASPYTTLYRHEHLARPAGWLPPDLALEVGSWYAETVQQALSRTPAVQSIRIPGRYRYLAALDTVVAAAVRGEMSAAEALEQAANEWEAITDELGREAQRIAYRESLNLQ